MSDFIVYTDGGSRNNPGPAAIGVVIRNGRGEALKKYGEYIGKKTNNEAEYQAAIFALKKIKALFGKDKAKKAEVKVYADSELVVKQMSGEYKIEDLKLQPLFLELWNLKVDFGKVQFEAVARERNREADHLVKEALDAQEKSQQLAF